MTQVYNLTYFDNKGQKIQQKIKGTEKQVLKQARQILNIDDLEIKGQYIVKKGDDEKNYVPYFEFKVKPITLNVMDAIYRRK